MVVNMTKDKFYKIVFYLKDLINGTKFEGKTYVVGGAVRDLYMNKEIKDIDIVLELPNGGIEFANWMEENGHAHGSVVTYPTYGTAMFRMKEYPEVEIECVQTRKEQYKDKNSRNPETEYGTLYEDAMRRDLSIIQSPSLFVIYLERLRYRAGLCPQGTRATRRRRWRCGSSCRRNRGC